MKLLEVDNVFSGYGASEILHGISAQVNENEIVTIIGPNGSGKSTLLKTIMGYLIPTRGQVSFEGKNVTRLRPDLKVRHGISYVPQLDNIFSVADRTRKPGNGGIFFSQRNVDRTA